MKNKEIIYSDVEVEIEKIKVPEILQRSAVSESGIIDLAESIQRIGLINRITVEKKGEEFELLAGYRRYLAHIKLKREKIPARVVLKSGELGMQITFAENNNREEINIVDEAEWMREIMNKEKINQAELAKKLGKSDGYISDRLRINEYPEIIKEAMRSGAISFAVGKQLAKATDENAINRLLELAIQNGVSAGVMKYWVEQENLNTKIRSEELEEIVEPINEEMKAYEMPALFCDVCERRTNYMDSKFVRMCKECFSIARENLKPAKS